jgi:hypothetical protein
MYDFESNPENIGTAKDCIYWEMWVTGGVDHETFCILQNNKEVLAEHCPCKLKKVKNG